MLFPMGSKVKVFKILITKKCVAFQIYNHTSLRLLRLRGSDDGHVG